MKAKHSKLGLNVLLAEINIKTLDTHQKSLIMLTVVVAALKLFILFLYAPLFFPESKDFFRFADVIIDSSNWMLDIDIEHPNWGLTSFRAVGYPLVIALMKLISPDHWAWGVVLLQMGLSLIATAYVFRLAMALSNKLWLGWLSALSHATGQAAALDQVIFSNALSDHLMLIIICHIGIGILRERKPRIIEVIVLGILVTAAFLVREVGLYLQILIWPLLAYWVWAASHSALRAAVFVAAFAMPVFGTSELYKTWNEMRTGERYITTGGVVAYYLPSFGLAERGVLTVSEDPVFEDMKPLPWPDVEYTTYFSSLHQHLNAKGWNQLEILNLGQAYFYKNWLEYPFDMVAMTIARFNTLQATYSFRPLETAIQIRHWATGEDPWPREQSISHTILNDPEQRWSLLALTLIAVTCRLISAIVTAAFLIGVPILLLREMMKEGLKLSQWGLPVIVMFLCWLLYLGQTVTFAQIYIDVRYLMVIEPLGALIGLVILAPHIDKAVTYVRCRYGSRLAPRS